MLTFKSKLTFQAFSRSDWLILSFKFPDTKDPL